MSHTITNNPVRAAHIRSITDHIAATQFDLSTQSEELSQFYRDYKANKGECAMKQNNWAIRMVTGGPYTEYRTRASARASAKHRSRFDDVAYEVLRRDKTAQGMWILVETQDFHKAIRDAFQ